MKISSTQFLDFLRKSGAPRLTAVREMKKEVAYDAATDFWLPFKAAAQAAFRKGNLDKAGFAALAATPDAKKSVLYADAARGLRKFVGKQVLTAAAPPRQTWTRGLLDVSLRPELAYKDATGVVTVIKFHLKKDRLSAKHAAELLALLVSAFGATATRGFRLGVIDVIAGRLYPEIGDESSLFPLLDGEAAGFVAMYAGA